MKKNSSRVKLSFVRIAGMLSHVVLMHASSLRMSIVAVFSTAVKETVCFLVEWVIFLCDSMYAPIFMLNRLSDTRLSADLFRKPDVRADNMNIPAKLHSLRTSII